MMSIKPIYCRPRPNLLPLFPLKSLLFSPSPPSSLSFASPRPKPFPTLSASLSSYMDPTTATVDPAAISTTVEHVVLFKVRDGTDPVKIDAMVSNLRSLASLPAVVHLTAGPILRSRSAAGSAAGFTHLLHSRYRSKPDLAAYSSHPDHLAVVKADVLPVCDDIMAVDWLAAGQLPPPAPRSAMCLTFAKPKEGTPTTDILAAMEGIKGSASAAKAEQLSIGENFSPARAKGYTVGFISVFKSLEELEALVVDEEVMEAQKEKVRPLLDSVMVVDFLVPQLASSSL